jgi:glyoxylase-like metal-dependent hydrolase (beta-lactamase superfamily II)
MLALCFGAALAVVACSDDPNPNQTTSSSTGTGGTGATGGNGGAGGGMGGMGGGSSALAVETYVSEEGVAVDSHLIFGATEAILVDGQFFSAGAQKVVDMVKATGKNLTTVFLTHAHPDHYVGMDVIKTAFPNAKFVTTQMVLVDYTTKAPGTFAFLKGMLGGAIPDKIVTFEAVGGTTLTVDGQTINIIDIPDAGESEKAAILEIPDQKAVFAGDLVYNKVHLWLAECQSDGWKKNLDALAAKGYTTYYPGHGPKATAAVVAEDKAYIDGALPILMNAATSDDAQAQLKAKFPDYTGDGLLDGATDNYFMNCK